MQKWHHLIINSKWLLGKISQEHGYDIIFHFNINFLFLNHLNPIVVFPACYSFFFYFFNSMARMKLTPKKEREGRTVLRTRAEWEKIAKKGRRPPSPVHHPSPARNPSPAREVEKMMEEAERWVEEARQLEEVGWSPLSLLTWQLAQMAAEARPSVGRGAS